MVACAIGLLNDERSGDLQHLARRDASDHS
jgi:hypothetical protein